MLLVGCNQGGDQQEGDGSDQSGTPEEQQPSADEQQMPEQMEQQGDIDVSDEEIEQFVSAANEIQELNRQMQEEVGDAIEDEGMDRQRFDEIHRSQQSQQPGQSGQQGDQSDATDEEMEQYQSIIKKLQNMQSGSQKEMQQAIEDAGLSMQRYQEIAKAAQMDSSLMKKLQEEMGGSMGPQ
ncbi:MAG: DUF4168 domain-containing protein [Bacteroidota bacterium]